MVQLPEDAELGLEELLLHLIHFGFLDYLHSPQLIYLLAFDLSDFSESTLSNDLAKSVAVLELRLVDTDEVCLLDDEFLLISDLWLLYFVVRRLGALSLGVGSCTAGTHLYYFLIYFI